MAVFITGVSGTGKSTIAKRLKTKGYNVIDLDDGYCYWKNKKSGEINYQNIPGKKWIEENEWICDVNKLKSSIREDKDLIAVGAIGNQKDVIHLFDTVILLQCNEKTLIYRLNTRNTNDFGKDLSEQESILGWYKYFEEETMKLGAVSVNTEQPLEIVVEEIEDLIKHN